MTRTRRFIPFIVSLAFPSMTTRAWILALAAMLMSIAPSAPAQAQAAPYPSKPIKVVVPFPPGGGGDILARLMLTRVGLALGQPMIFENLAGAGGNVGSATAARAEPDGYTLVYGTNGTLAINQTLYKKPGFDSMSTFEPVSRLSQIALVVVVRPGMPANSMAELLALLKSNPGKYTFGSAGNGTTSHLAGEMLKSQAGLAVVHIPYRGGALAITDLIAGQIDMMIEVMPNAMPQVKSKRVTALAVSTLGPAEAAPELPTIASAGLPGFQVTAWDALMAPAGTPPAIVARLNAAVRTALADPALVKELAVRGADPAPTTPAELRAFIGSEIDRWGAAVKRSGASVE